MRRFLAVAAGAVVASGCLLTTSLDELSKGSSAATTDSGGGTDSGGAGTDGTTPPTDAPTGTDSTTTTDAPADAPADNVVATTFCTGKTTTYCEDFDREPFDSAWTSVINPGGCFAERRTTMSPFSTPKGFLASCNASAAGDTMGQAMIHRFPGQLGASITVSCMVRIDEMQSAQYSNGMTVVVRGASKEVYAQLGYESAGPSSVRLLVEKYGGDDGTAVVGTIPKGEWRRIDLKVEEPDATNGQVTVTTGASSASLDVMTSVWPPAGSRGLEVAIGVFYTETPGTTIAYDDCTIDKKN